MLAGWRLAVSVGLAGVRQQGGGVIGGGGVRLEGAAGQVIGRAVRCSSGGPTPPRPGRSGRLSPWAARSFPVLIGAGAVWHWFPAAPDPPARGTGHGSRWHRSRAAQFRRRMIRQNAARAKGSDSSLNGISPHR